MPEGELIPDKAPAEEQGMETMERVGKMSESDRSFDVEFWQRQGVERDFCGGVGDGRGGLPLNMRQLSCSGVIRRMKERR